MRRMSQEDLSLLSHNFQVRFALFCAYQVKDKWDKIPECYKAIRVVSLWLEGKASSEECRAAAFAADCNANCYGGHVAGYVAFAAVDAVHAANCYGSYVAGYVAFAAVDAVHAAMNAGYAVAFTYGTAYSIDTIAADATYAFSAKILKEQWDFYYELLHFDEIVEKALLGEEI